MDRKWRRPHSTTSYTWIVGGSRRIITSLREWPSSVPPPPTLALAAPAPAPPVPPAPAPPALAPPPPPLALTSTPLDRSTAAATAEIADEV